MLAFKFLLRNESFKSSTIALAMVIVTAFFSTLNAQYSMIPAVEELTISPSGTIHVEVGDRITFNVNSVEPTPGITIVLGTDYSNYLSISNKTVTVKYGETTEKRVTIYATGINGGVREYVTLKIAPYTPTIPVASITLDPIGMSLDVGATGQFIATISPSNATNKTLTWKSSDDDRFSVNENGVVTATLPVCDMPPPYVTATDASGNVVAKGYVCVNGTPVTSVELNTDELLLELGETATLEASVIPVLYATVQDVEWESSNNNVATVNGNGTITTHSIGTTTITVTTLDGGWTATSTVTVVKAGSICSTCSQATNALNAASPGDVIYLEDREYSDCNIKIESSGQENNEIVFRPVTMGGVTFKKAQEDEHWGIIIEGDYIVVKGFVFQDIEANPLVAIDGVKYSKLTECAFYNCGDPDNKNYPLVSIQNSSQHCSIDHCYFDASAVRGITVKSYGVNNTDNSNNTIAYNYFKNFPVSDGSSALQIGEVLTNSDLPYYTNVEYNVFENVLGDTEIISNKCSYNSYTNNVFIDCEERDLTLRFGTNCTVNGNYFYNSGGIRIEGNGHVVTNNYLEEGGHYDDNGDACFGAIQLTSGNFSYPVMPIEQSGVHYDAETNDNIIAFNTMVNYASNFLFIGRKHELAGHNLHPNNNSILFNMAYCEYDIGTSFINDDVGACSLNEFGDENYAFNIESGSCSPTIIGDDPLLLESEEGLFKLQAASHVFVYDPEYAPTVDFDGQARANPYNVGCDQYSSEGDSFDPYRIAIGPQWLGLTYSKPDGGNKGSDDIRKKHENNSASREIEVYPNPSNSTFNIHFNSDVESISYVKVYGSTGQLVLSKKPDSLTEQFNMSEYSKGLYFVRVEYTDSSVAVSKIVLSK